MSPRPSRTIAGASSARSTTVVGSSQHGPLSMMRSSACSYRARISRGSLSGCSSPAGISVDDNSGSSSSASSAWTTAWSGTRMPIVLRFGCCARRGTSRVAGSRKVAADERQMMLRVDSPQRTNALGSRDVPDAAAERVARIGRICDYAAGASDRGRLPNQATLRVDRMDGEVLGQSKGAACSVAI